MHHETIYPTLSYRAIALRRTYNCRPDEIIIDGTGPRKETVFRYHSADQAEQAMGLLRIACDIRDMTPGEICGVLRGQHNPGVSL